MSPPRPALCIAVVLLLVTCSAPVAAQSDEDRAGARAAATQGAQAFTEGRWDAAIDLFSRAETLIHSPVHQLYLARSYLKLNQLVKAREMYLRIAAEQQPAHAPAVFRDAQRDAQQELAALEPRIPYVSVVVQGGAGQDVRVTMDGARVPPALVGVPRPIDPGQHTFQAFTDGLTSSAQTVNIGESSKETVVLTLQAGVPAPAPVPQPAPAPPQPAAAQPAQPYQYGPPHAVPEATPVSAPPADPSPADQPPPSGGGKGLKIGGGVVIALGLGGLAMGTAFGLTAKGKLDDANELCAESWEDLGLGALAEADRCDEADRTAITSLDDEAESASTLAIVGFAAGGAALVTGVTLLIVGVTKGKSTASAPEVRPWLGLGSAGLVGRF